MFEEADSIKSSLINKVEDKKEYSNDATLFASIQNGSKNCYT